MKNRLILALNQNILDTQSDIESLVKSVVFKKREIEVLEITHKKVKDEMERNLTLQIQELQKTKAQQKAQITVLED